MEDFDRTTRYAGPSKRLPVHALMLFDMDREPRQVNLAEFGKAAVTFGRGEDNDIVLASPLASQRHGRFVLEGGQWRVEDMESTNGTTCNGVSVTSRPVSEGDFVRIGDGASDPEKMVLFVFSGAGGAGAWSEFPLDRSRGYIIGREDDCDIVLPHVTVSKCHARLLPVEGGWQLADCGSTNGVLVNDQRISGKVALRPKDVVTITNSKLIFTESRVYYCCYQGGVSVEAANVVVRRRRGTRRSVTCDHVSLSVKPGELVAIVGGSGAGKSTLLSAMCGYLQPNEGQVTINGVDLYRNFGAVKKLVGYVPQADIVYNNLTLRDMLRYTARLRLPEDTSDQEREAAVDRALAQVDMADKQRSLIRALSGGERKRASIAVELVSDPNLLFLDEPASGLDPYTERRLMATLREMANDGRTIVLVTHSTLQLAQCDRIAFMGKGGKLCYYGSLEGALRFFGVKDAVDIYGLIAEHPLDWSAKYAETQVPAAKPRGASLPPSKDARGRGQLGVLAARYAKLVANDRQRLLLLLIQAPALAFLISLVANGNQFRNYSNTKGLLFALSCSAFWIGMLNAIQEVCKERTILRREYMTGLSLTAYIGSKLLVMGLMCLVQSAMVTGVFAFTVGLPEAGVLLSPFAEMLVSIFLTAVASAATGLFVSSLFKNADRAMTVAPILLMPQILFSGLIFKLEGIVRVISWLAVCRWSMEGLGTTSDLNTLMGGSGEAFYTRTPLHLLRAWGMLALFTLAFLALAQLVLARVGRERG